MDAGRDIRCGVQDGVLFTQKTKNTGEIAARACRGGGHRPPPPKRTRGNILQRSKRFEQRFDLRAGQRADVAALELGIVVAVFVL